VFAAEQVLIQFFIAVSEVAKSRQVHFLTSDIAKNSGSHAVSGNVQQQFFRMNIPRPSAACSGILYSDFGMAQGSHVVAYKAGRSTQTPGTIPVAKPKLYPCKECGRAYKWKHTLLRHIRLECGKEPQFQCPYCPQKSKLKCNLKQHILCKHVSVNAKYK
jgi:uncharacterized Zn-finger protein